MVGGRAVVAMVAAVAVLGGCGAADDEAGGPGPVPTDPATVPPFTLATPDGGGTSRVPAGDRATVIEVVDGDTLEVRVSGREERLRLVGINAPEDGECLDREATALLTRLVAGRTVRLVRDRSDRDQYGRLLRHVLVGGRSVGERLVAAGLAWSRAYPPDTGQQAVLDAAQARAEAAGVGLWSPDACGPATTAAIGVGAVRTDPPGDESRTPYEEWVTIVNRGRRPVDLTGWGVQDISASHRFAFPDGFRLGPGAGVRLRTGCGRDTATDLHWCISGSAVWNNDGDTVIVTDPRGNVVATRDV